MVHGVHQSMTLSWLPAQSELAHTCKKWRQENEPIRVKMSHLVFRLLRESNFTTSSGTKYYFDSDGFNGNGYFTLVNLVDTTYMNRTTGPVWKPIGSFQSDGQGLNLNTVIWPGGSPLLPDAVRIADTEKIRLVLKLSLPFVMQTAQYSVQSEQTGIKVKKHFIF